MTDLLDSPDETPTPGPDRALKRPSRIIGSFSFHFADQRWEWSDEVAQLHGYEPGTVHPTTDLVLSHKHPEDRDTVAETLEAVVRNASPFCSRHRIIDTAGHEHRVLVVADLLYDSTGATIGTSGYYIDLDTDLANERQRTLDQKLPDVVDARACIEQAKGALMLVYGITADDAFNILKWRSQQTNTKLRDLATKLVDALPAFGAAPTDRRTRFDHLLLTAHELPPATPDDDQ